MQAYTYARTHAHTHKVNKQMRMYTQRMADTLPLVYLFEELFNIDSIIGEICIFS